MWRTESSGENQRQILCRNEALAGEITALLVSAMLTAAIPTYHQSFFCMYLRR